MFYFLFPFFIMHACIFVLIPPKSRVQSAVQEALAPFDMAECQETEKVYLTDAEIQELARCYQRKPADLSKFVEEITYEGHPLSVDSEGIYWMDTFSSGYWDWYAIGGRWNNRLPGAVNNVVNAGKLACLLTTEECLPYYLVTPDGEWIEDIQSGWQCYNHSEHAQQGTKCWIKQLCALLKEWSEYDVVCVDIHC